MPEWITPELRPVWWRAGACSFSRTTNLSPRSASARATAKPTIPAPTTTTLTGKLLLGFEKGRRAGRRHASRRAGLALVPAVPATRHHGDEGRSTGSDEVPHGEHGSRERGISQGATDARHHADSRHDDELSHTEPGRQEEHEDARDQGDRHRPDA